MNLDILLKLKKEDCYEVVNTNNQKNFNSKSLPKWISNKVNK